MSAFSFSRRRFSQGLAALGAAALLPERAFAQTPADMPLHGLSAFGDLKYGPDFSHFDYANPDAPVGGAMNLTPAYWYFNQATETFDTLNTFVLQGNAAPRLEKLYDGLMTGSLDEPDALYGALAESVALSADRNTFTFRLREGPRFSTGAPVTAADVAFSYRTMKEKGHPSLLITLRELKEAVADDPRTVRLVFSGRQTPQEALEALTVAVLPEAFFAGRPFERTGLDMIPGSGAYTIGRFDVGRFIEYRRREDYWAWDLPFARGLDHFETLRIDFFRDRQPELEAFKKGQITFREEFTTRSWATEYDFPAVREKRVVKAEFPEEKRPRFQCWALNQRRERFRDVAVRRAINMCFDFEWTNANILFRLRTHSDSPFEGSPYKAEGTPSPEELALLEPLRGKVPEEVFGPVWVQPVSDGSGNDRKLLREALRLFTEAGWTQRDGRLRNAAGEVFSLEFLLDEPIFTGVYNKFFETLRRLGVEANFRVVDGAQYQDRVRRFDFDMILAAFSLSATPTRPGLELFFGSGQATVEGSNNFPGMADPGVDALLEAVGAAKDRAALVTAMRCLDRTLRWRLDWLPNISAPVHRVAYWDMFGFRETKPDYAFPVESLWWYDAAKARAIGRG